MSIADNITRMMNSIDELYPMLRFLRVSRYNDWKLFSMEIGKVSKHSYSVWQYRPPPPAVMSLPCARTSLTQNSSPQNTKTKAHAIGR
jgi:hypothetical protein